MQVVRYRSFGVKFQGTNIEQGISKVEVKESCGDSTFRSDEDVREAERE